MKSRKHKKFPLESKSLCFSIWSKGTGPLWSFPHLLDRCQCSPTEIYPVVFKETCDLILLDFFSLLLWLLHRRVMGSLDCPDFLPRHLNQLIISDLMDSPGTLYISHRGLLFFMALNECCPTVFVEKAPDQIPTTRVSTTVFDICWRQRSCMSRHSSNRKCFIFLTFLTQDLVWYWNPLSVLSVCSLHLLYFHQRCTTVTWLLMSESRTPPAWIILFNGVWILLMLVHRKMCEVGPWNLSKASEQVIILKKKLCHALTWDLLLLEVRPHLG